MILKKQEEHLSFLAEALHDPRAAFRLLSYLNMPDLAETILIDSLESVRPHVAKLIRAEYDKMLNKKDEQKCRILIPKSRLLFGVCDAWGVLKEGECAVRVTMDGDGAPRALTGTEVIVTRNPCLHPGDMQKLKVVERQELAHLVDCIVFPTTGRRPPADMMSGGDLDGDTCKCLYIHCFTLCFINSKRLTDSKSLSAGTRISSPRLCHIQLSIQGHGNLSSLVPSLMTTG